MTANKPCARPYCLVSLVLLAAGAASLPSSDVSSLVRQIKSVGIQGAGNEAAREASRALAQGDVKSLLPILESMDDADPIASNWLRSAVDTIAEREVVAGRPLPLAELEKFVFDQRHNGRVRRLAFEWLAKVDASAIDRLIPRMMNDSSLELRRDAVAQAVTDAQKLLDAGDKTAARTAFHKAFDAARDNDQVMDLAKRLESLGDKVDLTQHFGCVQAWHLIAPFDNTAKSGFDREYPPEKSIQLNAEYSGKTVNGETPPLHWSAHTSADQFGVVDLNKVIGKHMGVVAYAVTELNSNREQPARIHVGSTNAVKLWLNGKLIYTRDEYHHGMSMDQYQATGTLKSGRNIVLLKVCQNEQTEEWAQNWTFQVRVCDPTGGGIARTSETK